MTIRCIAFDLDDTLWPCSPLIAQAERRFYQWLGQHYPQIPQRYSADELIQHRIAYMRQNPQLHHNLTQLRKNWLTVLAQENHCAMDMVEAGFQVFWLARNEVSFFQGALDTLEVMAEQFITGVITNGNASVHHIGIGHLFHFTHNSEIAGVAKPHPDIFHQALAQVGVKPHEAVYVGDDYEKDIQGAANAGLRTVWFNPQQQTWQGKVQADAIISTLDELHSVIQVL